MDWLKIIATAIIATATLCAYVYGNFETKADSLLKSAGLEKKIDVVNDRLEYLIRLHIEKRR